MLLSISAISPYKKGFVLCLHGVRNNYNNNHYSNYMEKVLTDYNNFTAVIDYLSSSGYQIISLEEFYDISQAGFRYQHPFILLTIDDGYQNTFTDIYPYLKAKGIPWALFISTHHIDKQEMYYTYRIRCATIHTRKDIDLPRYNLSCPCDAKFEERKTIFKPINSFFKKASENESLEIINYFDSLLSAEEWAYYNKLYSTLAPMTKHQLKILSQDPLVYIGSHCHHHLILNEKISDEIIYYEMQLSKKWIEDNLGKSPIAFCYPNGGAGDFSPTTKIICKKVGYQIAFTFVGHCITGQTDPFEIPRFGFPDLNSLNKILLASALPQSLGKIKKFFKKNN